MDSVIVDDRLRITELARYFRESAEDRERDEQMTRQTLGTLLDEIAFEGTDEFVVEVASMIAKL